MRIESVRADAEQQVFVVRTWRGSYSFPYGKADPAPDMGNPVSDLYVDEELALEGFTYRLASGHEGSVVVDQVLDYNQDPAYMRNMLLYRLTLEAQRQLRATSLSKREIIRRLGTSPAQFYRLIDQTNSTKSIDKVLSLLQVLGCDVQLVVHPCGRDSGEGESGHVAYG
ncbi:MAG: hypothetical protein Q7W51_05805 [Coriobacteriia bacterium]|nr:hypothetical protein [Coriobacteriia bacterium]